MRTNRYFFINQAKDDSKNSLPFPKTHNPWDKITFLGFHFNIWSKELLASCISPRKKVILQSMGVLPWGYNMPANFASILCQKLKALGSKFSIKSVKIKVLDGVWQKTASSIAMLPLNIVQLISSPHSFSAVWDSSLSKFISLLFLDKPGAE